ncbi:class I SAM-dependent methyltransferase [Pararhodobacter sp. SW119]|uniref:class I SAM-dependent methyltransferase n=1 Tax=Pararhodobacter sp. SW119 TaxID=2780075 RepID=UPI001AE087AB|nr:class I SAM-dependent methyltransferase [Pararhodobacter sp. SW119]
MGFASEWLDLREPADRAARNPSLLKGATGLAGAGTVVDLGSGTGATLRALAPGLPDATRWRLLDHDAQLLATATARHPEAEAVRCDLARLVDLPLEDAVLVTASALLDLVSEDWLANLVARLSADKLPFYAALSYNGRMNWEPDLPRDPSIAAAFNADQRQDKGLGPALGPAAVETASSLFEAAGYVVTVAKSPWWLDARQPKLQAQLLEGIAAAAARAGEHDASSWREDRLGLLDEGRCEIGHLDLLAVPKGMASGREHMGDANG